jgi:hypothetical protein
MSKETKRPASMKPEGKPMECSERGFSLFNAVFTRNELGIERCSDKCRGYGHDYTLSKCNYFNRILPPYDERPKECREAHDIYQKLWNMAADIEEWIHE